MAFDTDYSTYYDLLYQDKDYAAEARYIHALLQRFTPGAKRILELGCGSGKYTALLADLGYEMTGIDLSSSMIKTAQTKYPHINFKTADIKDFHFDQGFDAVISFFHVMSYQNSNMSLTLSFGNIAKHLKDNGVFIFDCWYGPAVLTDRPHTRIKRVQNDHISVTRLAEPTLYPNQNTVDVNYELIIARINGGGRA